MGEWRRWETMGMKERGEIIKNKIMEPGFSFPRVSCCRRTLCSVRASDGGCVAGVLIQTENYEVLKTNSDQDGDMMKFDFHGHSSLWGMK
jgi:hypothetical protein